MEKLPKQGNHIYISDEEISELTNKVKYDYETYLKTYGVTLPKENSIKERQKLLSKKQF